MPRSNRYYDEEGIDLGQATGIEPCGMVKQIDIYDMPLRKPVYTSPVDWSQYGFPKKD